MAISHKVLSSANSPMKFVSQPTLPITVLDLFLGSDKFKANLDNTALNISLERTNAVGALNKSNFLADRNVGFNVYRQCDGLIS